MTGHAPALSSASTAARGAPAPEVSAPGADDTAPVGLAAPSVGPAIRVENVQKRFGRGPLVLDGIDLAIAPGEFVCLVGASGCGKSTLLDLIAGLDTPTSGRIDTPVEGSAVMFQDPALMPWMSARRNVELALRLRGVPRPSRRAEALALLDSVNLADAAEKRPHELSGGMRQRVALARALAQDRPVLLMDEPFAALDAITRDLLHEELEKVWRVTGRTIVFVTHNVREAARLGQRVVLLSSRPGRVVEEWRIMQTAGRRIESPEVAALSMEITDQLRKELRHDVA